MKVWFITEREEAVNGLSGQDENYFSVIHVFKDQQKAKKKLRSLKRNVKTAKDYFTVSLEYELEEMELE